VTERGPRLTNGPDEEFCVDASVWILGLWVGAVRTRSWCGPRLAPWPPGPHQSQDVMQNNRADRWAGLGEKECCGAPGT